MLDPLVDCQNADNNGGRGLSVGRESLGANTKATKKSKYLMNKYQEAQRIGINYVDVKPIIL